MADPFRGLDPLADDPDEKRWVLEFKKRRRDASTSCAKIKRRATENHRFATPGEEQLPFDASADDGGGFRRRHKRKFALMSINEVHPVLSTMSGRQVMGRFERRYIPRKQEVRRWSEVLSDWDRAVVDASHADQEESAAFRNGPGVAGLSWLEVSVDYLEDPDGMIVVEEVPIWNMLWPAHESRKKNLLDRDWDIRGEWYRLDKFKALWPTKLTKVRDAIGQSPEWTSETAGDSAVSSRVPWEGMGGSVEGEMPFYDRKERQIWVEHYQRREISARWFVNVPTGGTSYAEAEQAQLADPTPAYTVQEMTPEEYRAYARQHQEQFGEEVPANHAISKEVMRYYQSYHVGDVVLEEGEIPIGRWRREAMTGYPFVQSHRVDWRSVVDALRTPQIWTNIFLTMLVKYMQINPKGTLFVERGVFRNRNEGLSQFASTGGLIEVEHGKLSAPNPPYRFESGGPSPMQGFVQHMLNFSQEMIPRSVGFNWAALGQLGPDLRRISGTVVEHVRDAMVASQAELYDSLALCRQRLGLIFLATLGHVLGIEHLRRVVGDEPFYEPVMEQVPDPMTGEMVEQPAVDPETGEPVMQEVQPPADLLDEAVWSVSVEETRPAPDRMRFFWESAVESGGLQTLKDMGAIDAEGAVEIIPDMPEEMRQRWLARVKVRQQAMQRQSMEQQQPEAA